MSLDPKKARQFPLGRAEPHRPLAVYYVTSPYESLAIQFLFSSRAVLCLCLRLGGAGLDYFQGRL
jgi:hypothetical protein